GPERVPPVRPRRLGRRQPRRQRGLAAAVLARPALRLGRNRGRRQAIESGPRRSRQTWGGGGRGDERLPVGVGRQRRRWRRWDLAHAATWMSVTGRVESAPNASVDGGLPAAMSSAARTAIMAPLSVHSDSGGIRTVT